MSVLDWHPVIGPFREAFGNGEDSEQSGDDVMQSCLDNASTMGPAANDWCAACGYGSEPTDEPIQGSCPVCGGSDIQPAQVYGDTFRENTAEYWGVDSVPQAI